MTSSSTLINSSVLANPSLTPVVPAHIGRWNQLYSLLTVSGIQNSIYKDTLYKNKHVIRNIIANSFNENSEPQHEILCCYCTARWAPYSPRYYLVRAQTYHIAKMHSNTPIGKEQLILIDKMSEALTVRGSRSNRKRATTVKKEATTTKYQKRAKYEEEYLSTNSCSIGILESTDSIDKINSKSFDTIPLPATVSTTLKPLQWQVPIVPPPILLSPSNFGNVQRPKFQQRDLLAARQPVQQRPVATMAMGTIPVHPPQGTTSVFQDPKPLSEIKTEPTEGIPTFSLPQSSITLTPEPTACYSVAASVFSRRDDFVATFSQIKAVIDNNFQIHSSTPHNSQLKAAIFALAADFTRVGEYKVDELIDAVFRHLGPFLINRDGL